MIKTNDEYKNFWFSLNKNERLEYSTFIENKWNEYRLKGFEIKSYLSGTFIEYKNNPIYSSREPIIHFLKSIDFLDEYKINKK